jgi:hypothetical protein
MARPHPAVWRLVHGVLVAYVLLLVFLLFQSAGDARRFLRVRLRAAGAAGRGAEAGASARGPSPAQDALVRCARRARRPLAPDHPPPGPPSPPARQHLSPSLGSEVDYRTYASDCRLYVRGAGVNWAVLRATVVDEFVVAHALGWWAKVHGWTF